MIALVRRDSLLVALESEENLETAFKSPNAGSIPTPSPVSRQFPDPYAPEIAFPQQASFPTSHIA